MLRFYFILILFLSLLTLSDASCQSPTYNLNNFIHNFQILSDASLEFYSAYPITEESKLSNYESLSPGKYYAVYNFGNGCLSEITPILILTNHCPQITTDLNSSFKDLFNQSDLTITYHSSLPVSDSNRLTQNQIDSATFGVYYGSFYDQTTLCYSKPSPIIFIENVCCPASPTISKNMIKVCYGDSVNMTASCISGNELWFTDSLLVGPSFKNIKLKPEISTSYFAVCDQYNCKSQYVKMIVDVIKIPKLEAASFSRCGVGDISLVVSGCLGQIKWYDNMQISTSFSNQNPLNISLLNDSRYYYATCLDQSCESPRTEIHTIINRIPSINIIASSPTCVGVESKSNGLILASRFYPSDMYQLNLGDSFDIILASSIASIPINGILKKNISIFNKEKFTIRVISDKGCSKDYTIELENNCLDCQIDYCKVPEVVKTN